MSYQAALRENFRRQRNRDQRRQPKAIARLSRSYHAPRRARRGDPPLRAESLFLRDLDLEDGKRYPNPVSMGTTTIRSFGQELNGPGWEAASWVRLNSKPTCDPLTSRPDISRTTHRRNPLLFTRAWPGPDVPEDGESHSPFDPARLAVTSPDLFAEEETFRAKQEAAAEARDEGGRDSGVSDRGKGREAREVFGSARELLDLDIQIFFNDGLELLFLIFQDDIEPDRRNIVRQNRWIKSTESGYLSCGAAKGDPGEWSIEKSGYLRTPQLGKFIFVSMRQQIIDLQKSAISDVRAAVVASRSKKSTSPLCAKAEKTGKEAAFKNDKRPS
ncbi:MAG: hypothetical protein Q9218_003427 [Villophora microphyllina]